MGGRRDLSLRSPDMLTFLVLLLDLVTAKIAINHNPNRLSR